MKTRYYNLLEKTNNLLLRLKKNRIYNLDNSVIGIDLGCENNVSQKYFGVDGSFLIWFTKNKYFPMFLKRILFSKTCTANHLTFEEFIGKTNKVQVAHHNLLYGIPFKDNSTSNVFTSHFIEHLTKEQAIKLIVECRRVLNEGGILRIVVPDLDEEPNEIRGSLEQYGKSGDAEVLQKYLTVDANNRNFFSFHRRMYNFNELKSVLEQAGFKKIARKERYKGKIQNVSNLDVRDGLIVEAIK